MVREFIFGQLRIEISKDVIDDAVIGGILGAAIGFLYKFGGTSVHRPGHNLRASPFNSTISGTMLGLFIGAAANSLLGICISQNKKSEENLYVSDLKLKLREEQLDISKKWVATAEVKIHKEILLEEKNIIVPTIREELVIEKIVSDNTPLNAINEHFATVRIPIKEERIEVIKYPVVLQDVEIHNHKFQETAHFKENLSKEKLIIKTAGDTNVIVKETKKLLDPRK